jgi:hypothetical protein
MPDPKSIKFQFQVDEASLQKTRQVIRELTSDLTKLNEAAGKFSGGGIGGGRLGGGVNVFGGGARSPESQRVLAKTAPIGRSVVQGFLDQKQIFKNISDGSKDAMRVMTESLHKAIGTQEKDLKHLETVAKELVATYDKLGAKLGRFKSDPASRTPGWAKQASGAMAERGSIQEQLQQNLADQMKAKGDLEALKGMAPQPTAQMSWMQRANAFLNAPFQQGGMLGPGSGAAQVLGKMGMNPAMLARGGLWAAGFQGVRQIGNEIINNPMRFSDYSAQRAGIFAGNIGASYGGDFRNILARNEIFSDPNMREDYQGLNGGMRRFGMAMPEVLKGLATLDFFRVGQAASGNYADLRVGQDQNRMVQNTRAADPLRDMVLGDITQGYAGRMGAMRALGVGDSNEMMYSPSERIMRRHFKGDSLQPLNRASYSRLSKALQNAGFDDGLGASALSGIESVGSRAAGYGLMFPALSAQAGGLSGAAGIAGTMSRYGMGAGSDFLSAARVLGAGSDVAVANRLASFAAGQAGAVNVGGMSGLGVLGLLSNGVGKGPGSAMIAGQNMAGFGALQNMMSGGLDSYQKARNFQVAIGAAPGAGIYAQDYLTNMNLSQVADIMSGTGGLSPIAKSLGVTKGMVGKYFQGTTRSSLDRIINDPMMAGTSMAKTMAAMSASGMDPHAWFASQSKHKGFNKAGAVDDYSAFLLMSHQAQTEEQATGLARSIFGMGRSARTKGKMVGDVAGRSLEHKQAQEMAQQMDEKIQMLEGESTKLAAAVGSMRVETEKMAALSRNMNATMEDRLAIEDRFNRALQFMATGAARNSKDALAMADAAIAKEKTEAQKRGVAQSQALQNHIAPMPGLHSGQ